MKTAKHNGFWPVTLGVVLALGACQTIAGIEERTLDPSAFADGGSDGEGGGPGDPPEDSAQCKKYCTDVMSACEGKNAVYTTEALCLGVCRNLDPGDPLEPVGNTVACRAHQASIAKAEPDENCRSAGPGGDGQCGSDCQAYCGLFAKVCPESNDYPTVAACEAACAGLTDQRRFDVIADHEDDSIECRLVHVSSATVEPTGHCAHAPVRPTEPWCTGKPEASPTCEEYCNIALVACEDDLAQYESREQCLDVCGALELGRNDDQTTNTVACRRYHAFSSTLAAAQHCPHSGPSGDGHCGDTSKVADGHTGNCESYCTLVAAACPNEFDATLVDAEQCMATCITLDEAEPESKYSVAKAKDSTALSCRILHAARAFADATACTAAVGGDPCQ
jgi:hypothetical protein